MRKAILLLTVTSLLVLGVGGAALAKGGAVRGTSGPTVSWVSDVDYLFNKAGYHLWFSTKSNTPNNAYYEPGRDYHNIYKYKVNNPDDWCGTTVVPNREPYNLGGTAGQTAWFKIWDATTETWACGSD